MIRNLKISFSQRQEIILISILHGNAVEVRRPYVHIEMLSLYSEDLFPKNPFLHSVGKPESRTA